MAIHSSVHKNNRNSNTMILTRLHNTLLNSIPISSRLIFTAYEDGGLSRLCTYAVDFIAVMSLVDGISTQFDALFVDEVRGCPTIDKGQELQPGVVEEGVYFPP